MLYPSELESDRDFFIFDPADEGAEFFFGVGCGLAISAPLWALIWWVLA